MSQRIGQITGGNKGLGFEMARRLKENGVRVYIGDRESARGIEAASLLGVEWLNWVVTDEASVRYAANRFADPGYAATGLNRHRGQQTVEEGTDAISYLANLPRTARPARLWIATGPCRGEHTGEPFERLCQGPSIRQRPASKITAHGNFVIQAPVSLTESAAGQLASAQTIASASGGGAHGT